MATVTPRQRKRREDADCKQMYYHLFRCTCLAYTHLHEAMGIIRAAQQQTEDLFIRDSSPEDEA